MSDSNERADDRARAEGFTSRSQAYRARKQGYGAKGNEYNAALRNARKGSGLVRSGNVFSADLRRGEGAQLWAALSRFGGDAHVRVTVERNNGTVLEVGGHGGMRLDYLRAMHARNPVDRAGLGPKGARRVTVTVLDR